MRVDRRVNCDVDRPTKPANDLSTHRIRSVIDRALMRRRDGLFIAGPCPGPRRIVEMRRAEAQEDQP